MPNNLQKYGSIEEIKFQRPTFNRKISTLALPLACLQAKGVDGTRRLRRNMAHWVQQHQQHVGHLLCWWTPAVSFGSRLMMPCHMSLKTSLHLSRIVGQWVLTHICLLIAILGQVWQSYFKVSDEVQGPSFGKMRMTKTADKDIPACVAHLPLLNLSQSVWASAATETARSPIVSEETRWESDFNGHRLRSLWSHIPNKLLYSDLRNTERIPQQCMCLSCPIFLVTLLHTRMYIYIYTYWYHWAIEHTSILKHVKALNVASVSIALG